MIKEVLESVEKFSYKDREQNINHPRHDFTHFQDNYLGFKLFPLPIGNFILVSKKDREKQV